MKIIRLPEVMERVGAPRGTLYRWIEAKQFPLPVQLGPKAVGWIDEEIDEWIATRPRAAITQREAA